MYSKETKTKQQKGNKETKSTLRMTCSFFQTSHGSTAYSLNYVYSPFQELFLSPNWCTLCSLCFFNKIIIDLFSKYQRYKF